MEQFITELHAMGHAAEQVHVGTPELEDTFRTQVFLDVAEVLYEVRHAPSHLDSSFQALSRRVLCTVVGEACMAVVLSS
jgi:hypothetical protein